MQSAPERDAAHHQRGGAKRTKLTTLSVEALLCSQQRKPRRTGGLAINRYLVADIGGTNARCAIADVNSRRPRARLHDIRVYRCDELRSIDALFAKYRADTASSLPQDVCLAVAGPITGDAVNLTNNDWVFSVEQLRQRHQFRQVTVINDLAAVACATRVLSLEDVQVLRHGRSKSHAPRVVVGAGTGLGIAALLHTPAGWQAVPSEAGHSPFAPGNPQDRALLERLLHTDQPVTWESIVSGPGLVNLYNAMAAIRGETPTPATPRDICALANDGDPLGEAAVRAFCRTTARFASSAALWFCSFGGVYLSGDIFRGLERWLDEATFFDSTSVDAAIAQCVESLPVSLILAEQPSLLGAAVAAHDVGAQSDSRLTPSLVGKA